MKYDTNELVYMSHFADEAAERALFYQFKGFLTFIVTSCLGLNNQNLEKYKEDLLQEAWIAFYGAINTYREDKDASFTTYVSLVVRRSVILAIRKIHTSEASSHGSVYDIDYLINDYSSVYDKDYNNPMFNPEYYLHFDIAKENLDIIFKKANKKDKAILNSWMDGKKYKEAANELNIPIKTYDGRKQSLKRRIKKQLLLND